MKKRNPYGFVIDENPATDVKALCSEIWNLFDEPIIFEMIRPTIWTPLEERRIVCGPKEFVFLPHGNYTCKFACGWEGNIPVWQLFGDWIGSGRVPLPWEQAKLRAQCAHRGDCPYS